MFFIGDEEEPDWSESDVIRAANFDLKNICTPVDIRNFKWLLLETCYDSRETEFIVNGFSKGFSLEYTGPTNRSDRSRNIPFTVGNKLILWNKMMKEVQFGRFAGPFREIPFQHFVQSPVGLVPKDGGKATRLTFHLSYNFPNGNRPINHWTPAHLCSVQYFDLDHAVRNSLIWQRKFSSKMKTKKVNLAYGKTDFRSAFRVLPLGAEWWPYLTMKARDPITTQIFIL